MRVSDRDLENVTADRLPEPEDVDLRLTGHPSELSDDVRLAVETEARLELEAEWPDALYEVIVEAANLTAEFRMHTATTGTINYRAAHDLGQHVVELLGKPTAQR